MDLPSNPETTPGMDGKGRLDLDRFLFGMAFVPIFSQNVYMISKKTQISQDQNLVDDFFHQKLPDKLPPKPGALRNFAPSKGRRSNLRCHLRPVAKSMNFVSTQPKCSSQISLFFFGLNKGKVKDLGAS